MTQITLNINDETWVKAEKAAKALQKTPQAVIQEMLQAAIPPLHDVPAHLQDELIQMMWLDNQALQQIAKEIMPTTAVSKLHALSQLETPTTTEQAELTQLRHQYGETTLRKARAHALLQLRS